MDLPDIKLIIQWCTPASILTLWQRFGRCVRNPSLHGTAILLAEKEYFEYSKTVQKKRKRTTNIKTEPGISTKRTKLSNQTNAQVDEEALDDEQVDGEQDEDADDEQEEGEDNGDEKSTKKSRKKTKKYKIEPAVFDLLNAEQRGLGCRRRPFMDKFQNSKSCECNTLS
jgi:superfamily II DNA/RNA helicase